ncbi:unnamed protein product [Cuscuta campestris]|uniref:MULE transposase domain-containing protein n=1 Tax=Cuscuta campestris TaxID=132261 RepID=A0A484NDS7_9ASTE|nr:unnamed protein product [Cuscuta campestris]
MNDIVCNIDMGGVEIQDFGLLNEDNDGDGNETEVEEVGDNNEENTYDVHFDQVLEAEEGLADVPEFFFEDVEGSDEEDILVEVPTKKSNKAKLVEMKRREYQLLHPPKKKHVNQKKATLNESWFSDEEDEDLDNLEEQNAPEYRPDAEMENLILYPKLKFKSIPEFRMAATCKYIGNRIKEHVKDISGEPLQMLSKWIYGNVKVNCSISKAQRARREAFRLIHGDAGVQYQKLWDYGATVLKHNPGSVVKIGIHRNKDNQPVFQKMFFTFAALIDGFLAGCRPIIGIDGCFLKSPFSGQLLCAVARDSKDNMFPLAFAIVPLFWRAASTAHVKDFQEIMEDIKRADPKVGNTQSAFEYLDGIPAKYWSRSHFPEYIKCDALTNNISESFNSYIREARMLPIVSMCENIRSKLMSRLHVKREGSKTYVGTVCPSIRRKMNRMNESAAK